MKKIRWKYVGDVLHNFVLPVSCALYHTTFLCPPTEAALHRFEEFIYTTQNVILHWVYGCVIGSSQEASQWSHSLVCVLIFGETMLVLS